MTDLATALANSSGLPAYGGKPVTRTAIKITNAGDGLSQGLAIDPQVLELGSTHYVVLECIVDSHEHDRIMDKGNDTGLLVLEGKARLPYPDELDRAHNTGDHAAGLVEGCPQCDDEVAVKDAEAAADAGEPPAPTPIAGRKARAKP